MAHWPIIAAVMLLSPANVPNATADVAGIVERSAEASNRDWNLAPGFSYTETDRTAHGSRTYRVLMIAGSPYQKLIAVDGEPLPSSAQTHEERKLADAIARRNRETRAQREKRVAAYQDGRRRDHLLISQLVRAFNFTLAGEQQLGSHQVYVLKATPRPGYVPPNRDTKVLTGMQGTLWVDTQTYQWVKVQAQVIRPVWIEGFLAEVTPGTRFALDYAPVTGSIWLPTHYSMQARAKVLGVFSRHDRADEDFSAYRKQAPAQ